MKNTSFECWILWDTRMGIPFADAYRKFTLNAPRGQNDKS